MRGGTGAKTRVIKAFDVSTLESFEFNRSINPRGGSLARMKIRTNKNGKCIVSLFQDTNDDGKVSRKELIFRGKSRTVFEGDELTSFPVAIRLKKTMHQCDWLSMKYPDKPLMCTEEYIPITFQFDWIANNGEEYKFHGIGQFRNDLL